MTGCSFFGREYVKRLVYEDSPAGRVLLRAPATEKDPGAIQVYWDDETMRQQWAMTAKVERPVQVPLA